METKRAYTGRENSQSGDWSRILPRRFTRARVRCHSLVRRLAVKTVMFAASANSSLVISSVAALGFPRPQCGQA